jgi:hypothetical protein
MLTTLLILAALAQAPKCDACATQAKPKASTPLCPDGCKCPFPSACGLPDCQCKPALGWLPPPKDRWATFANRPGYRYWGHYVGGTFYFSHYQVPGSAYIYAVHPAR